MKPIRYIGVIYKSNKILDSQIKSNEMRKRFGLLERDMKGY